MSTLVRDIMQKNVFTLSPDIGLDVLEQEILHFHVGGAPVLENGKVVGIVSRSDIVLHSCIKNAYIAMSLDQSPQGLDHDGFNGDADRYAAGIEHSTVKLCVRDIMSKEVHSVTAGQTIEEAAKLMLEKKDHRLLVMDNGVLSGIVSSMDFVKQCVPSEAVAS